ncbi:hypothetical protein IE81DRAFT_288556 [Ceraceosorus guamensis]|uniref:Alpha/beta hydrolase fold-3 domain-containing protein n=1 Tax=Ceraceosorus guamensis TaxID=1522189 RepID=A0A316W0V1_9BASI|nr:hypothetical protein IE81DRAFT_288556 [Ceraceosorus guamensis]PWN43476.1 hypothetical protein IE81DRAFT_288556 [Ceraceosorus guamensis]
MYALKVAGIRFLRFLIPVVLKFMGPKAHGPPAKPSIKLRLKTKSKRRVLIHIYQPSSNSSNLSPSPPSPPPPGSSTASSRSARPAAIINLHGSGFCFHSFGEDGKFCQLMADSINAIVFDVDYSHAPEHPFPAASEDVDAVLSFLQQGCIASDDAEDKPHTSPQASSINWDASKIALTGFSSGGNLVLTACVRAHQRGDASIKAVVAFYPSTDLAESPYNKPALSPSKGAAGGVLPPQLRHFLYACYLPPPQKRDDPLVSPIYASTQAFPSSTTIITCQGDSLAREARNLAKKLEEAGRDVVHYEAKGQGHNWDKMVKEGTEPAKLRDEAYELAMNRLQKALEFSAAA